MFEQNITFFSEGQRLNGTIYYPDTFPEVELSSAIVINSGYQGFNGFYPKMFATLLTRYGYVCLGFDYRGMADSEGEKGRVLIEEQAQDVRNAVTFIATQPGIDATRVGLVGWGMGAANVIIAADKGKNVAAVAALNGFYKGIRWLQAVHPHDRYVAIVDEVTRDRAERVVNGYSRLAATFEHYPLDPATAEYVQQELASVYGFGHPTQLQFTESILDLDVDRIAAALSPVPLFIAHGRDNALHPHSEAVALHEAAAEPKTFYTIDGRHNDFMYVDHPEVAALCEALDRFFGLAFANPARNSHDGMV